MTLARRASTFALTLILALAASLLFTTPARAGGAWVDPALLSALQAGSPSVYAIAVFDHTPNSTDVARLKGAGATLAIPFHSWPFAGIRGPATAINAVAGFSGVTQLWNAPAMTFYTHESIPLIHADQVWAPTAAGGLGINGAGITVAVIDSGINAGHPDLAGRVLKNLKFVEDQTIEAQNTDTTSGHGTHVAGTVAGNGAASKTGTAQDIGGYGYYTGVAPGASLVGLGVGDGLSIVFALQGFQWLMDHHAEYGVRVETNSWGPLGGGAYNPGNPISQAVESLSAAGVTILFAAGNDGDNSGTTSNANNTLNSYCGGSVICVAAGQKDRQLATFSSTGATNNSRTPTITAPGVHIAATRNPQGVAAAGSRDAIGFPDTPAIAPQWLPYYTILSGTSMATPHTAGVVALMTAANSRFTPTQYRTLITTSATPMPGYQPYQVGAGYVDAFAAVSLAQNTRSFSTFRDKCGKISKTVVTSESYTGTVGPSAVEVYSSDIHPFDVAAGAVRVTVDISWNTTQDIDLYVWADGNPASQSANEPGVPEHAVAEATCANKPLPSGSWTAEARGWAIVVPQDYQGMVTVEYLTK